MTTCVTLVLRDEGDPEPFIGTRLRSKFHVFKMLTQSSCCKSKAIFH